MGDLLFFRVVPSRPFSRAGVDYAGPIIIRLSKCRGNNTLKGYIAVFVCFVTHVAHLAVVEDYSSLAFYIVLIFIPIKKLLLWAPIKNIKYYWSATFRWTMGGGLESVKYHLVRNIGDKVLTFVEFSTLVVNLGGYDARRVRRHL